MQAVLAETVSIDGGTLLLVLAALLVVAALAITVVVFGFVLAPRAARGSGQAMGWWILILALESFVALGGVASILAGEFTIMALMPAAIITCQVAMFVQARKDAGR